MNITTMTVLENSPPYAPPKPDRVASCESSSLSLRRRAIQLPAPPPMEPRAFSGPRLAPPINDTAETTAIPGTSRGSTCPSFRSAIKPGSSSGRRITRRNNPTTTPAPAVTATHHHRPPNQPGSASTYHRPPNPMTPMNTRPANAPNTPRAAAYPMSAQNCRSCVNGGERPGSDVVLIVRPNRPGRATCRRRAAGPRPPWGPPCPGRTGGPRRRRRGPAHHPPGLLDGVLTGEEPAVAVEGGTDEAVVGPHVGPGPHREAQLLVVGGPPGAGLLPGQGQADLGLRPHA